MDTPSNKHGTGDILARSGHRPWPMPQGPWIMTQSWRDLLFAHWPIPAAAMRALVPPALELDTYDGEAWIGVVPFRMANVRPRLAPALPWLSHFPELNVRTYVLQRDRGVVKAGVYFFSLDAANPLAVAIARRTFRLPYYRARMHVYDDGRTVHYASHRTHVDAPGAALNTGYAPAGPIFQSAAGTLDHWLTERYALYTVDERGQPFIGEIQHAPWPLQPARAEFLANTMAGAAAIQLPGTPPLLHFARRLDVLVWPLRPLET